MAAPQTGEGNGTNGRPRDVPGSVERLSYRGRARNPVGPVAGANGGQGCPEDARYRPIAQIQ
ncbi:hypothetical protein HDA35_001077 [Micromonospora purpureochromogenes]|uniref:Uncharacterized protein n=1 Tax=Micromonospora purpureochromogenes TaxID=47872 RepID=A0ABX2RG07_9ACTN|nr:hypothetical protein [Micromonospora purpureochromogenes]